MPVIILSGPQKTVRERILRTKALPTMRSLEKGRLFGAASHQ
jgi:hypothetical protein